MTAYHDEDENELAFIRDSEAKPNMRPQAAGLDVEDLETIETIARNEQSGRITRYEVNELVRVYRAYLAALASQPVPAVAVTDSMVHAYKHYFGEYMDKSALGHITPPTPDVGFHATKYALTAALAPAIQAGPDMEAEAVADDIRRAGWLVAVHNDYRLNGEAHTFWLFTKEGAAVKGEGRTDADALNAVRAQIGAPPKPEGIVEALREALLSDDLVGHIVDGAITRCRALPDYAGRPAWEVAIEEAIREAVAARSLASRRGDS
ncbi:MAG: hypothetical protein E5Y10_24670 [Mesorhizobium sp.]|nr:MAG: hypothetical protein E5Y10_24670 [Mesorhizobium sp.]